MSGHSKWHSIKHKKAATDAKRGKVLTKHSKILNVIGRNDPNPETNAALRVAIVNAKADSVPRHNIERILKKLSGNDKDGVIYSQQVYEGFGPDGIPFMVTALTDNVNRTFPDLRTAWSKSGGTMGSSGSVNYLFDHVGIIVIKNNDKSEDDLFEAAIEAGAQDFSYDEEGESEVITAFTDLSSVQNALTGQSIDVIKSEPQYRAKDPRIVEDEELFSKIERFTDALEEVDDVDEVFGGFEIKI